MSNNSPKFHPIIHLIQVPEGQSFEYQRISSRKAGFRWHYHSGYELHAVIKGEGWRMVGDNLDTFSAGDLVLLGPNLPHCWYTDGYLRDGRFLNVVILRFTENSIIRKLPEIELLKPLFEQSLQGVSFDADTWWKVYQDLLDLDGKKGLPGLMLFLEILHKLSSSPDRKLLTTPHPKPLKWKDQERIDRVLKYLHEHSQEEVSLVKAAQVAHLSVSAFSVFFKRTTGKSLVEYLTMLRISQACQYLVNSEKSISEIAYQVGYRSLSAFYRCFRQEKGMSPRKYRIWVMDTTERAKKRAEPTD